MGYKELTLDSLKEVRVISFNTEHHTLSMAVTGYGRREDQLNMSLYDEDTDDKVLYDPGSLSFLLRIMEKVTGGKFRKATSSPAGIEVFVRED